jgi:peroxiredoxin
LSDRAKEYGVQVIGINVWEHENQRAHVKEYRERHRLTFPLLLDEGERYAAQFGLQGVPTNVLVDPFGRIREIGGTTPQELKRLLKREVLRNQVNVRPAPRP